MVIKNFIYCVRLDSVIASEISLLAFILLYVKQSFNKKIY